MIRVGHQIRKRFNNLFLVVYMGRGEQKPLTVLDKITRPNHYIVLANEFIILINIAFPIIASSKNIINLNNKKI